MDQQSTGEPLLSVDVTTDRGSTWVGRYLRSPSGQELTTDRFEVVLVQHGPDDGTVAHLAQLRASHPYTAAPHVDTSANVAAHRIRADGTVAHVLSAEVSRDLAVDAAAADIDDVVVANSYVACLEYRNLTAAFDVLLVNDARTLDTRDRNSYLPSKRSDYAGSGRPIWGIVEPGCALSSRPLAYRSELGDVDGARAGLRQLRSRQVDGRVARPMGVAS